MAVNGNLLFLTWKNDKMYNMSIFKWDKVYKMKIDDKDIFPISIITSNLYSNSSLKINIL